MEISKRVLLSMNNRENFFNAIHGKPFEKVPFMLDLCTSLQEEFSRQYNTRDFESLFGCPFTRAELNPSKHPVDYTKYFQELGQVDRIDEWGVGYRNGSVAHFATFVSPMSLFETPEEVWDFPLPDMLADYRWEGVAEHIRSLKEQDRIVMNGTVNIDIFEPAWYLRGMENFLMDMLADPEMAEACLDRIANIKTQLARKFAEAGVDVLVFGDDVGTERGMMMSVETWRTWLKPRLAAAIRAAKEANPEVLCYYHSDGDIREIIPELIEVGVDILNPIQPECMDPVEIYNTYVDRVAFWGTIGTQTTMPFGTREEVVEKTSEMLELCKERGKLVIAPTHLLEPEVPVENIMAFVNTVHQFNEKMRK